MMKRAMGSNMRGPARGDSRSVQHPHVTDPPVRTGPARLFDLIPPPGLVLIAIVAIQLGAALAVTLFPVFGPTGTVLLRIGLSALVLLALTRPNLSSILRSHARLLVVYGFMLAAMNLCFYEAIARLPLGIAVTIDFMGPLGVAVATSRRPKDFAWIGLAIVGIMLLAPDIGGPLDPVGVLFAAGAAVGWASFILLSRRLGRLVDGNSGLAIGMAIGAILLLPLGLSGGGLMAMTWALVLPVMGLALLSTAIPFVLEYEALKRLPARTYGVLVTLEPAVATCIGAVVLGDVLGSRAIAAVVLVTVAAVGATLSARQST